MKVEKVVPSALDKDVCSNLREQVRTLQRNSVMTRNHTHLVSTSGTQLIPKQSIFELDSVHPDFASRAAGTSLPEIASDPNLGLMLSLYIPELPAPLTRQVGRTFGKTECLPKPNTSL